MRYKWVENYTNMVHNQQNMGFLKLDIYVVAASNIYVEIIDFFDLRKIFVTRGRARDVGQVEEAFAILKLIIVVISLTGDPTGSWAPDCLGGQP